MHARPAGSESSVLGPHHMLGSKQGTASNVGEGDHKREGGFSAASDPKASPVYQGNLASPQEPQPPNFQATGRVLGAEATDKATRCGQGRRAGPAWALLGAAGC